MLERGQEVTEAGGRLSKWRLVRVAVVALSGSTYVGRLFFGDSDTGEVVWDCDVRPSDGKDTRGVASLVPGCYHPKEYPCNRRSM